MKFERVHVVISGQVQGIGFRAAAHEAAKNLGVVGWVRNRPDGDVESTVEGTREQVQNFVEWCRKGPAGSVVVKVRVEHSEATYEFQGFTVAPTEFRN
ncbi:MAG: acylphosphatase [Deltaproteobacteria bacterium]|nr:acylphosphatase [Deltaproteobacteria bacterium]